MGGRGGKSGTSSVPASNVASWGGKKEKDPFFGTVKKTSNKYMVFDQVSDKDHAIIMTRNIQIVKGNAVMVTGQHTAIYLRDNQFRLMEQRDGTTAFAVKISRDRFKEYTFRSSFDFGGEKDTFDSLWRTSVAQHRRQEEWKSGGRIMISDRYWKRV